MRESQSAPDIGGQSAPGIGGAADKLLAFEINVLNKTCAYLAINDQNATLRVCVIVVGFPRNRSQHFLSG